MSTAKAREGGCSSAEATMTQFVPSLAFITDLFEVRQHNNNNRFNMKHDISFFPTFNMKSAFKVYLN